MRYLREHAELFGGNRHSGTKIPVLVPKGYYKEQSKPLLSLVNLTDRNITLNSGTQIAEAVEADTCVPGTYPCVAKTETGSSEEDENLPDFLNTLYEKSCSDLNKSQKQELKSLLFEFSDVFASGEFDLGTFSALEHEIDTGDSRPIKQRMRRTPMCFVDEEEPTS